MNKFGKFFAIVVAATLFPSLLFAQTPSTPLNKSTSTEALILSLQTQIKALQTRIAELEVELGVRPETSVEAKIDALGASVALSAFDRPLSRLSR